MTNDLRASQRFLAAVDAAAIIKSSTRFDGGFMGLGAEISISTDKFHARGPWTTGVVQLQSVLGDGRVRE